MSQVEEYSRFTFVIKNFITKERCDALIKFSEEHGFHEATVTTADGFVMMKDVRDNDRIFIDSQDLADELWDKIKSFIPQKRGDWVANGLNERFRFYRYSEGQKFDWHYDGSFERNATERSLYTLILYLNDDYEGGKTEFETYVIEPKKGDALVFLHKQLHRGAPIESGTKYVLRTDVMYTAV